jgi:hypothetical protein
VARTGARVDQSKLHLVADKSPELERLTRKHAREIMDKAKAVFLARQVASNEWRTSATTPPKYIRSFRIEKFQKKLSGYAWIVRNVDPASSWVEYGAHAGGRTLVLRYYPLKTALVAQGLRH